MIAYIVGFACLYLPVIQSPTFFKVEADGVHSLVADALYFSAVTFFTVGYGDIGPIHPVTRFLSAIEGGIGLLTISLTVTYLVSVFPLINRKLTLAASLNNEAGGRTDGVVIAERYVAAGRFEALGERLRTLRAVIEWRATARGVGSLTNAPWSRAHDSLPGIPTGQSYLSERRAARCSDW